MAPVAVDAWSGVCVGIIFIESSGWIAIMLDPESSILGILLHPFLNVAEFIDNLLHVNLFYSLTIPHTVTS